MKKTNKFLKLFKIKKTPKKTNKVNKRKPIKTKTTRQKTAPKKKSISKSNKRIKNNRKSVVKPKKNLKSKAKNKSSRPISSTSRKVETEKQKSKKYNAKAGEVWYVNDKKTRGHKSIITKRRKSNYEMIEHIPITHKNTTRKKENILLSENPEKEKKDEPCYALSKVQKTHYSKLGTKQDNIRVTNPIDKSIIRHIKKENKRKNK